MIHKLEDTIIGPLIRGLTLPNKIQKDHSSVTKIEWKQKQGYTQNTNQINIDWRVIKKEVENEGRC